MIELGYLNLPIWGLKILYGGSKAIELPNGGKLCLYAFSIIGQEAVSFGSLRNTIKAFKDVGSEIEVAEAADIEDGGRAINLI